MYETDRILFSSYKRLNRFAPHHGMKASMIARWPKPSIPCAFYSFFFSLSPFFQPASRYSFFHASSPTSIKHIIRSLFNRTTHTFALYKRAMLFHVWVRFLSPRFHLSTSFASIYEKEGRETKKEIEEKNHVTSRQQQMGWKLRELRLEDIIMSRAHVFDANRRTRH